MGAELAIIQTARDSTEWNTARKAYWLVDIQLPEITSSDTKNREAFGDSHSSL